MLIPGGGWVTSMPSGRRCAVLGHPIAHSLSPVLHRAAYARLGIDWTFERIDVPEEGLAGWIEGAGGPLWRGLALTMPLKRAVLPLLDDTDHRVQLLGAANTLLWDDDGSRRGANTDVPGLLAALCEDGPLPRGGDCEATVLGGGATAAAAVLALAELGITSQTLRLRDVGRAGPTRAVAERCGVDLRVATLDEPWSGAGDVLVSTVPSQVAAAAVPGSAWAGPQRDHQLMVADVTYHPWPSPLLQRAIAAGARTVTGVDLLAHQAVGQVRLMTGSDVPAQLLRTAALSALGHRPSR